MWVLGSGSAGNAIVLEAGDGRVLVDAGFAPRELSRRLRAVGIAPESIESLVLTHEHHDHSRGIAAAARWRWTVHASAGTAAALGGLTEAAVPFEGGATVALRTMSVCSVRVAHDAVEPVAIVATAADSGARIGIAYDVGHVTPTLRTALAELDVLVLESNHDEGWLRAGPYPPSVRARIAGPDGHLSNRAAAALGADCAHKRLTRIVLAHLSQRCNSPRLASDAVCAALSRTAFRGQVLVSAQDTPLAVPPFASGTGQLAFSW
jgi:phosphoribosyl 1,2-cyclic phosphodiesterase